MNNAITIQQNLTKFENCLNSVYNLIDWEQFNKTLNAKYYLNSYNGINKKHSQRCVRKTVKNLKRLYHVTDKQVVLLYCENYDISILKTLISLQIRYKEFIEMYNK